MPLSWHSTIAQSSLHEHILLHVICPTGSIEQGCCWVRHAKCNFSWTMWKLEMRYCIEHDWKNRAQWLGMTISHNLLDPEGSKSGAARMSWN